MRRTLLATWLLILVTPGCTHFDYVVGEFDSATNLSLQRGEPTKLEYQDEPKRWTWIVRSLGGTGFDWLIAFAFGLESNSQILENPSGYVRERLLLMTQQASGDLVRTGQAASRLLWIAAEDQVHALNQATALAGLAELTKALDLDPLDRPSAGNRSTRSASAYLADRRILAAAWPGRRHEGFSQRDRELCLAALARLAERPAAEARHGRDLLRDLAYRLPEEGDAELAAATEQALREVLTNEVAAGFRQGLRSISSDVRETATLALYELSGPAAVPYCLAVLQGRGVGALDFDPSPELRRVLIRICGQLRGEILYQSSSMAPGRAGPMPIRFLYETARDDRDKGLRSIALEALALCLGKPIVFDQAWADEWWRDFLAQGAGRDR